VEGSGGSIRSPRTHRAASSVIVRSHHNGIRAHLVAWRPGFWEEGLLKGQCAHVPAGRGLFTKDIREQLRCDAPIYVSDETCEEV
jgi:hypothetical protein